MKDNPKELFILVDENDNELGTISRKEAHTSPHLIHRAISVFIFNTKGEMLLQKRSTMKDTYPNCWTVSVGGHVEYGQTYEETAVREMQEEIGVMVRKEDLVLLGKAIERTPQEQEMDAIYKYVVDDSVTFHPAHDEVSELRFASLEQVQNMLQNEPWSAGGRQAVEWYLKHAV